MWYPRSLLARQSRPWKARPPRRSVALADQLDAYLGLTAPLRRRPPEASLAVQGTLWDDGPIPIRRERPERSRESSSWGVARHLGRGSLSG